MMCRVCRGRFEPGELGTVCDTYPYGDGVCEQVTTVVCPDCGSDEIVEMHCCAECNGEFDETELRDGLCRVCEEELLQTLDWAWAMLTPAQKVWATANTAWMDA